MFVNCIEEVNTILMHGMALYYLDGTLWTAFYDDINPELVKLDDLRKRGILTDTEFDAQKKKLLEGK